MPIIMGKLTGFDITLNNPDGVYCAGQILQGILNVELKAAMKLQAIWLIAKGKAFVHWTEQKMRGPGESRFKEVRHHSSTEEYFDYAIPLLTSSGKNKKIVLPSGRHSYPFQFQLPPNLPASFEGEYGYIRYWVKALVEKPLKSFSHVTKSAFTIIGALDLNYFSDANKVAQENAQKRLCCLCCISGPVTAYLSLERKGFVPGEPVFINAEIENLSRRKMKDSSVELKMTSTFYAAHKSRSITTQIFKIKRHSIGKCRSDSWNGEYFIMPALPPSYLLGCNVIDIHYTLELKVDPMGPGFPLSVPVEIIVGTVPLHTSVQQHLRLRQNVHQPAYNDNGAGVYPPPPTGPNMLSSTYAESIFGRVCIKDEDDPEYTRGNLQYVPLYKYYIFDS